MIPALRRQRQADLCEFEDSLVYRKVRARAMQRNLVSKNKNNNSSNKRLLCFSKSRKLCTRRKNTAVPDLQEFPCEWRCFSSILCCLL